MDLKINRRVLMDEDAVKKNNQTHVEVKVQKESRRVQPVAPSSTSEGVILKPQSENAPDIPVKIKKHNGNGHASDMKRKLTDSERDCIRARFLKHDGQFDYRNCRAVIKPLMGLEVTVWQICGFISRIHDEVYCGDLQLQDPAAYFAFMAEKYPKLHARYMAKYPPQSGGDAPVPKFAQGFPGGKLR